MPKAIDHIALVVSDPARTAQLLIDVLDGEVIPGETGGENHRETHIRLGGTWFVLVKGHGPESRNGDHIAFGVSKAEQLACTEKLTAHGVEYQMAREDTALYFTDYDNHVFELETLTQA
jgi:hypothetical protein